MMILLGFIMPVVVLRGSRWKYNSYSFAVNNFRCSLHVLSHVLIGP